jgi:ribosome maturation factor RimP
VGATDDRLFELTHELVRGMGFALVDVRETAEFGRRIFRFFIDHDRGISVANCGAVSRELAYFLDAEDPIEGAYSLEVSSPGLDHDLVTEREYAHFKGRAARLVLRTPVDGVGTILTGELMDASEGQVTIRHAERGEIRITLNDIAKARLEF